MKTRTEVKVREIPGEVVQGLGGNPQPVTGAAVSVDRDPIAERIKELAGVDPSMHVEFRDATDWGRALGVIADDPDSLRLQIRIMAALWWLLGAFTGVVVMILLRGMGVIH